MANTAKRRYYLKNRDRILAQKKQEYAENRELIIEKNRARYKANPELAWAANIERKFGITAERYHELLEEQSGVCAICGQQETAERKGKRLVLAVDHDHSNGRVRGLLCSACNKALGAFRDDPAILCKALEYLHEHRKRDSD